MRTLTAPPDYDAWRAQVRELVAAGTAPEEIIWREADDEQGVLIGETEAVAERVVGAKAPSSLRVPREYGELAHDVFHHRSAQRFWVLYRLLWRLKRGERDLLKIDVDDDVRLARLLQRQVKWDAHRMTGFVRFEKTTDTEGELYLAWYRPDHHVLPLCAGSFVRRFAAQRWSILTPEGSAHWDTRRLRFGPGVAKRPTSNDQLVALWKTYYTSTYNPHRDNPKLFRQHVPTRFLQHMPEGEATYAIRSKRRSGDA